MATRIALSRPCRVVSRAAAAKASNDWEAQVPKRWASAIVSKANAGTRLTPSFNTAAEQPPASLNSCAPREYRRDQRGFGRRQRDIEVAACMFTVDAQRAGEPDRDFDRADEVLDCPRVGVALLERARIGQFLSRCRGHTWQAPSVDPTRRRSTRSHPERAGDGQMSGTRRLSKRSLLLGMKRTEISRYKGDRTAVLREG